MGTHETTVGITNSLEIAGKMTMAKGNARKVSELRRCPGCKQDAHMRIETTFDHDHPYVCKMDGVEPIEWLRYEILTCPACNGVVFRRYRMNRGIATLLARGHDDSLSTSRLHGYLSGSEVLYPHTEATPDHLPEAVKVEWLAAEEVKTAPNAYGVMLGRVLEAVCADRQAAGHSLHEQLQSLASKGEIPEKLVKIAMSLKHLRNVGAHQKLGRLEPEDVPILAELCLALVEYVYAASALVDKAQALLDERKT